MSLSYELYLLEVNRLLFQPQQLYQLFLLLTETTKQALDIAWEPYLELNPYF